MSGIDILAEIQAFSGSMFAPPVVRVDVSAEVRDHVGNRGDILRVVNAVGSGREFYPCNVPMAPGPQGQRACANPPKALRQGVQRGGKKGEFGGQPGVVVMPLFELGANGMTTIEGTSFAAVNVKERQDLQRWLREKIETIVPGGMVLTEEFSNWEDSKRSIDLLVLDRDANLVVVELKRTVDGGHMELQAIRYAAMISAMTFQQAVETHGQFLVKHNIQEDPQARILDFLEWDEPEEDAFAQEVRIVLASADFSKELTTAVLWLNEHDVDIRCVRMVPYKYGDAIILDVQQIIPLPEVVEYQVKVREKASQERAARHEKGGRAERNHRFWSGLLQKANAASPLHQNISPSRGNWVASTAHGVFYSYVIAYGNGRVELYITRPDRVENKAIFDDLHRHKQRIEQAFGENLSWQRLDDRVASRIAADIQGGPVDDESSWDALHDAMVNGMKRLEAALRPFVEKYRHGASPDMIDG